MSAEAARKLPAGVLRSSDVAKESFARVLLLGTAKIGKTTTLLQSAPKPLVINCDGEGATQYAAAEGADFYEIRVGNVNGVGCKNAWTAARRAAKELAEAGEIRSIIVDTITLLGDNLVEDLSVTLQGFDLWNEIYSQLVGGYKKLAELPAHLFVVGHMDPREDEISGIMPLIPGKAKAVLPTLCADWVLFDYEAGRKPHERAFLLGPQKSWTHSGRNVRRVCQVEPSVPALLKEMGFEP
jgi:hypothetical protein